eukprot:6491066-Amphidinium_carterae.2
MQKRMTSMPLSMGQNCGLIKWDRSFTVDWLKCGLYTLLPAFLDTHSKKAEEHGYDFIECCGKRASLVGGGFQVKGSWKLASNWSLAEARLIHPTFPDTKLPCYQCFCGEFMNGLSIERVPELRSVEPTGQAPLALFDAATAQQQVSESPSLPKSAVQGPPSTRSSKAKSAKDILNCASPAVQIVGVASTVEAVEIE